MLDYFMQLTTDELKTRLHALQCQEKISSLKKGQLVDVLARHFELPFLKQYWSRLDDFSKNAIAEAIYNTPMGSHDVHAFATRYGKSAVFKEKQAGQLFEYMGGQINLLGAIFFDGKIPYEICERFKTFVSQPDPFVLTTTDQIPNNMSVVHTDHVAMIELSLILQWLEKHSLTISDKTDCPSAPSLKNISELLVGGDYYAEDQPKSRYDEVIGDIRSFGWIMCLRASKLTQMKGSSLNLSTSGIKALVGCQSSLNSRSAQANILKELWKTWLDNKVLDEFRRIDNIKGQKNNKRIFTVPSDRRHVIQKAMQTLPVNQWVSFKEFSAMMVINHLKFDVTRDDPWELYINSTNYGRLGYEGAATWKVMQDRYMLCFLFEYAATLGLIDVAYTRPHGFKGDYEHMWGADDYGFLSRYDGLAYIRLNRLGAYCLDMDDYPTSTITHHLTFHPDGTITSDQGDLPVQAEMILRVFGEPYQNQQWRITLKSLNKAIEGGKSFGCFIDFLSHYHLQPPTDIDEALHLLHTRTSALQYTGPFMFVNCLDDQTADHIMQHPQIKKYCKRMGAMNFLVPQDKLSAFNKIMENFGYIVPK